MKKADIAAIILITAIAVLGGYYVCDQVFGDPFERVESVEYMDKYSDALVEPDSEVFNRDAINPTVEVVIGNESEEAVDESTAEGKPDEGQTEEEATNEEEPVQEESNQ